MPIRPQRGYILPLTLAVLVMLTVIGSAVGKITSLSIEQARVAKQRVDAEFALASAKAKIVHLLALLPRNTQGIGEGAAPIRPDGRAYAVNASVIVRIQDLRGLLPLNPSLDSLVAQRRLGALLKTYGVEEANVDRLLSALQDYRDSDDLQRINGADGVSSGSAFSIRNEDLLVPAELSRVKGWGEVARRWKDDPIEQYVDTHRMQAFNPNFAPARVLAAVAAIQLDDAKAIVKQRLTNPDLDIAPVLFSALNDPFGSSGFVLRLTGPSLRITLQHSNQEWAEEFVLHHSPDEVSGPWRISRTTRIAAQAFTEKEALPPMLPTLRELRPVIAPRVEFRL